MLPWRRTKEREKETEKKKKSRPASGGRVWKTCDASSPPYPPTTTTCLCLLKFEGLLIGASSLKAHLFGTFCKVLRGIMKNSGAVTASVTSRLNHGFRQRCSRTWAPRPDASPRRVLFPGEVRHIHHSNAEQLQQVEAYARQAEES